MKSRAFFRKFPSVSRPEIFSLKKASDARRGEPSAFLSVLLASPEESRLTRNTKRRRGKSFYFDRDRGPFRPRRTSNVPSLNDELDFEEVSNDRSANFPQPVGVAMTRDSDRVRPPTAIWSIKHGAF